WATTIQLAGTLFFNVTTFTSLLEVPSDVADRVVWRPDALGSVCFLVSSVIAFAEAGHRWWSWRPRERDWHITALNLWGSVFFGLSAVGAHYDPSGGMSLARLARTQTRRCLSGTCGGRTAGPSSARCASWSPRS